MGKIKVNAYNIFVVKPRNEYESLKNWWWDPSNAEEEESPTNLYDFIWGTNEYPDSETRTPKTITNESESYKPFPHKPDQDIYHGSSKRR